MDITIAKKVMGKNFIGPDELLKISDDFPIKIMKRIPTINFDVQRLEKIKNDYVLILGSAKFANGQDLTINKMRSKFGFNPAKKEPCFYNQDWYLKEKFASKTSLKFQWYLIRKKVVLETRGQDPKIVSQKLNTNKIFPTAILTAYTFFAYYFLNNKQMLWKHDFVWCSDCDKNGDRIYTGRYQDPKKINKNGFNIHRHLSIRPCYGAVVQIIK